MIRDESPDAPPVAASKPREALFDVAKGIGILLVLGHHSFNNSSRNFTVPHSIGWWCLTMGNRILDFSVPAFLLISAVLSARSLATNPRALPFYRRRLPGILWPYLAWTLIYWCLRMLSDKSTVKPLTVSVLGHHLTGPAFLVQFKLRFLDVVWGKAAFHLYFLVVLAEIIILLPAAVAYVRARKPGFAEVLLTSFVLQALILVGQHLTALLPYPASTALWYIGSLLPGAWIGANWELFREQWRRYAWPLLIVSIVSGGIFLQQEIRVIHHLSADNYTSNGALAVYSSCMAILALSAAIAVTPHAGLRRVLQPLGRNSLQIYLIHPAIMQMLERPAVLRVLNPTFIGPLLSPAIMLGIAFGLIWLLRVAHLERLVFGRA